jgi:hypothetical protein
MDRERVWCGLTNSHKASTTVLGEEVQGRGERGLRSSSAGWPGSGHPPWRH